ncbi:MAG: helix-turn-helix transcriptional regulator [Actinomycetota bacterium]
MARLGYATPSDAAEAAAAADGAQGPFLPLVGEAITAAAAEDAGALDRVATRFDGLGFTLWAAEFGAKAADRWSAAGDQRAATASERAAERAREQVGEARTTALARSRTVDPLTRRQREIAALVAAGRRNNEIAERLHVSVRTVETHLRAIYRKLGVPNRRELAAVIEREGLDESG